MDVCRSIACRLEHLIFFPFPVIHTIRRQLTWCHLLADPFEGGSLTSLLAHELAFVSTLGYTVIRCYKCIMWMGCPTDFLGL